MGFKKIELSDFNGKDVSSVKENPLIGDAVTNKQVFDKAAKEVLMPAFNALIDALGAEDAAGCIGATGGNIQDVLDGLSDEITEKVATAIAQVVADAPEDLDTLKELSDWIKNHNGSAAEMNSAIEVNKKTLENKVSKDGDTVNGSLDVNGTLRGKYIYIGSTDEDDIHLDTYRTYGELVNKVLYFDNSTDVEIEPDIILRNIATPRQDNDATNKAYVDGLVGDIETALDEIISIQNTLTGGDA